MSNSLPSFFLVKTLDMSSVQPHQSSTSRDLKTLNRRLPGHRYDVRMRLEIEPWQYMAAGGWLEGMQRDNAFFTYSDPAWQVGTNKTVNGSRSAGDSQVAFTSISGVEIGHFVNFASHAKLYRIVDIAGNTVTLNTPLQSNVAGSSAANMAAPTITLELAPDLKSRGDLSSSLTRNLSRINLRAQEAL